MPAVVAKLPAGACRQRLGIGLAAASDCGSKSTINQDAFWMSGPGTGGPGSMVVICDGVSNSQEPHMASGTAAMRAGESLLRGAAWEEVVTVAQDAVAALPFDEQHELPAPSTTLIGVKLSPGLSTASIDISWAWVGDSRIYWLPPNRSDSPRLLTEGHVGSDGKLERCLGRDADAQPGIGRASFPRGGRILLCTDGLWGYDPSMYGCALKISLQLDSMDACDALIAHALSCGGRDNVSVAILKT